MTNNTSCRRCRLCGRELTNTVSISRKYGPICYLKIKKKDDDQHLRGTLNQFIKKSVPISEVESLTDDEVESLCVDIDQYEMISNKDQTQVNRLNSFEYKQYRLMCFFTDKPAFDQQKWDLNLAIRSRHKVNFSF